MKIFSGAKGKKLDRGAAMAAVGINLFATPGLGSIIAGRYFVGVLQLILAAIGFCLIIGWMLYWFQAMVGSSAANYAWLGKSGLLFFGVGWLGSLWSSLGILRESKTPNAGAPPKLDGTPG